MIANLAVRLDVSLKILLFNLLNNHDINKHANNPPNATMKKYPEFMNNICAITQIILTNIEKYLFMIISNLLRLANKISNFF